MTNGVDIVHGSSHISKFTTFSKASQIDTIDPTNDIIASQIENLYWQKAKMNFFLCAPPPPLHPPIF